MSDSSYFTVRVTRCPWQAVVLKNLVGDTVACEYSYKRFGMICGQIASESKYIELMKTVIYLFGAGLVMMLAACGQSVRNEQSMDAAAIDLRDYGKQPTVLDIEAYTLGNDNFRTALWTGTHLQLTVMSIPQGGDVGLEVHPDTDQFLRIEQGEGRVMMGRGRDNLDFVRTVGPSDAIMVPAGSWHNVVNTGTGPLRLYSVYAPVEHPFGTIQRTQADAEASEAAH